MGLVFIISGCGILIVPNHDLGLIFRTTEYSFQASGIEHFSPLYPVRESIHNFESVETALREINRPRLLLLR